MTIKLYAESGSRGFKANQVEIPIKKVLANLERQGKQEAQNIDTVAKADLNRHKLLLDSKLRADKVQIDNIRANNLFYENNREWIEKWEQKELDDRVKVARQEYQAAQVSRQRQPDQSLLEKLGPALAKGIPMVVGAIQQQQAIQAEADTAAAKDLMFKLDWTPSQLTDYRNQLAALGEDTAKQEAFYESLIGTYSTKTGHVFDRSDFVRLLENSTGAYSISANKMAALNGVGEYEQRMKVWALENRHNFHDPIAYQQAYDKQKIEVLHGVYGKDAWNDDIPHAVKFGEIAPELRKVDDAIIAAQHRHLNNVSADIDQKRLIGDVQIAAAKNDFDQLGKLYDYRVQRFGGNHSAATYDFFKDIDHLAKNGQIGLEDLDALLRHARETTGNHNLGIGDNHNGFTARIEQARYLVLNSGQQNANILKQQQQLGFNKTYEATARMLEQEPGAAATIYKTWMDSLEYQSATVEQKSKMKQLIESYQLGAPVADTKSWDKRNRMIGGTKLMESHARDAAAEAVQEQAKVSLGTMLSNKQKPGGLDGVQKQFELLIQQEIPGVLQENSAFRDNPQANMVSIINEARNRALVKAKESNLFQLAQDDKDKTKWSFTAFPTAPHNYGKSDSEWNTWAISKKDETDTIYMGRGTTDQAKLNQFAEIFYRMRNSGRLNELTYQQVRSYASSLSYIREGARVLGIPVTQFFADQVKSLHPEITLPDSVITTTEEAQQAGNTFKSLLSSNYVYTPTASNASVVPYEVNSSVLKTSYSASGANPGRSQYIPPMGRLQGIGGSRHNISREEMAYAVNTIMGEAGPDDDKYYVLGVILNRKAANPHLHIRDIVSAPEQFVGYKAGRQVDQQLLDHLMSDEGMAKTYQAQLHLGNRTQFRGRSLYHNMGDGDIRPNNRSNYYFYAPQAAGKHVKYNPAWYNNNWQSIWSGERRSGSETQKFHSWQNPYGAQLI